MRRSNVGPWVRVWAQDGGQGAVKCFSKMRRTDHASNPQRASSLFTDINLRGGVQQDEHIDLGGQQKIGNADLVAGYVVGVLEPHIVDGLGKCEYWANFIYAVHDL